MKTFKQHSEQIEAVLDEANHREFASQGKMHPDMAKRMTVGKKTDYYEPKTGDKVSGEVLKNDGKEVHVPVLTARTIGDLRRGQMLQIALVRLCIVLGWVAKPVLYFFNSYLGKLA